MLFGGKYNRGITAMVAFVVLRSVPACAGFRVRPVQTARRHCRRTRLRRSDAATALMLFSKQTCAQKNAASADQIVQAAQADQAAQTPRLRRSTVALTASRIKTIGPQLLVAPSVDTSRKRRRSPAAPEDRKPGARRSGTGTPSAVETPGLPTSDRREKRNVSIASAARPSPEVRRRRRFPRLRPIPRPRRDRSFSSAAAIRRRPSRPPESVADAVARADRRADTAARLRGGDRRHRDGRNAKGQPGDAIGNVHIYYSVEEIVGDNAHFDGVRTMTITGHPFIINHTHDSVLTADTIVFDTISETAKLLKGEGETAEGVQIGLIHFHATICIPTRTVPRTVSTRT